MLTLEEILRRFTSRRTVELPTAPTEPLVAEPGPVVVSGMAELIQHFADQERQIAEQNKRIQELETELRAAKSP